MYCTVQRGGVTKSSESNNNELPVLFAIGIIPNVCRRAHRKRRRGVALLCYNIPNIRVARGFRGGTLKMPCVLRVLWI